MQRNTLVVSLINDKEQKVEREKNKISSVTDQTVPLFWIKVQSGCCLIIPPERSMNKGQMMAFLGEKVTKH